MKPTKNNWLLRMGIFILFATLIWIFTQIQAQTNPTDSASQLPAVNQSPTVNQSQKQANKTEVTELFFFAEVQDGNSRLYSLDPAKKEKKLLYYDKDEENKIIRALGLDKQGRMLVLEGKPEQLTGGTLATISTDGKAEKQISANQIFSINPPVLSPNKEQMAITSFSNAESDFGFALFIQNIDGSNKRKIRHSNSNMLSPRFSPDSSRLAYVVNLGTQGSKIEIYTINKSSSQTILDSPKVITSIEWLGDNLVASASPVGTATANQSELYEIKIPDGTLRQLTDNLVNENNLISFDNAQYLAYISQKLPSGATKQDTAGEIKVYGKNIDFGKTKANYVFGWEKSNNQ